MIHDTELLVMKFFWLQKGAVTYEEIAQNSGVAPNEVATILHNLLRKGIVQRNGDSYQPLLTASEYTAGEIRELVNLLYGGDAVAFLEDYINAAEPEDRAALEMALQKDEGDRQM